LRTIKKKREEGFIPVYLDETWVDTHHTASHQWTSDSIFKNKKIWCFCAFLSDTMIGHIVHNYKAFWGQNWF
jgi:hypothetical protein